MLEFDLHQLGWFAFEELCRTICREVWHQPVEAYSRGRDGGRDGSFFGTWLDGSESSPCVLQCKHTSTTDSHLSLSGVEPELAKAKLHVEEGRCDVYVLMTNARVTGESAAAIEGSFRAVGVNKVVILGFEAICELLTEHKALRALVPRLYGLGDLTEILDERSYVQAEAILATMHDDLARLVPVEAHRAAHRALRDHRFVLLIGRPGSGKSSIAASLAIGAMDLYGSRPVKLSDIESFKDGWNPRDPDQFFWLDDGFGATQYEYASAGAWNRASQHVAAALRTGARLILTSRDYVYAAAKDDLKMSAFPLLEQASVIIQVESFTDEERQQILYNHLRLGRQDRSLLKSMQPKQFESAARDDSFLPELARRLGDPMFAGPHQFSAEANLLDFFRRPMSFLLEVLRSLDGPSQAALGLVHLRGGRLPSPYVDAPGDHEFLQRVGQTLAAALGSLAALDGSLLRLVSVGGDRWWQFQHPTLTDAYQLWLAGQPELLAEYLASARFEDLVRTVTCGNVGLEGALVVPRPLYGVVADRLVSSSQTSTWQASSRWRREAFPFLARRCDEEFLRSYIARDTSVVSKVFDVGIFLSSYTNERALARLLLELGLAADADRKVLVERLTEYAVDGIDGSFLDDPAWLEFFTADDLAELDRQVLEDIDALEDRVSAELSDSDTDPSTLDESLSGYEARYPNNPHIASARNRVEEFTSREPDDDSDVWREDGGDRRPVPTLAHTRSVFDDVGD